MNDLLTTTEVAELHGVTRNRVLQWIYAKDLPAKKFNQSWMVKKEDAKKYKRKPITGRPRKVQVQN